MTDVFISYARSTESEAKQIAEALRSVELAHAAIRVAGDDGGVLTQVINIVAFVENDFEAALRLADRALELNPGSPEAWAASGVLRLDPKIAIQHLEMSMRLDPIGPNRIVQLLGMGRACFFRGALSGGRVLSQGSDAASGKQSRRLFIPAVTYGRLREAGAAREALDRFRLLTPLSPADFTEIWTFGIPPQFVKLYRDGIALAEARSPGDGPIPAPGATL
jgi:tetratricopeptide (TPR) repeat protein